MNKTLKEMIKKCKNIMQDNKKDPKRIYRILGLIEEVWGKNPDLRLYQLLGNCFHHTEDLYYVEDHELEHKLKKEYKIK